MVHKPDRLADIFVYLREVGLEPKTLQMVLPHEQDPPVLVLVSAVRAGKPMLTVLPHLVIHDKNGHYTKEICEIYGESKE